jgi:hypothetical protein
MRILWIVTRRPRGEFPRGPHCPKGGTRSDSCRQPGPRLRLVLLRKEARRSAVDPTSGRKVALFHPRRQRWRDHFRWVGVRILGLTPTGRATVSALRMNRPLTLAIREEEAQRNRHPPAN